MRRQQQQHRGTIAKARGPCMARRVIFSTLGERGHPDLCVVIRPFAKRYSFRQKTDSYGCGDCFFLRLVAHRARTTRPHRKKKRANKSAGHRWSTLARPARSQRQRQGSGEERIGCTRGGKKTRPPWCRRSATASISNDRPGMQVIRWHATQERADRRGRGAAPSANMSSGGDTSPLAPLVADPVCAAAPRDHRGSPARAKRTAAAQTARRPEPSAVPLSSPPPMTVTTTPVPFSSSSLLPSASVPFSFLSTTAMTASLSLDDLAAREEKRAAQRRRRGDVDRVLQIFDEVDAHFASLRGPLDRQARMVATTTTMLAPSGSLPGTKT